MKFKSAQIKGKGRGKLLGFPTINLEIPADFNLKEGIYAVKVSIDKKEFSGTMHFGPIPVFNENAKSLEVFLINTDDPDIPDLPEFEIETIQYLRPVLNFASEEDLSKQIANDVKKTKGILNLG